MQRNIAKSKENKSKARKRKEHLRSEMENNPKQGIPRRQGETCKSVEKQAKPIKSNQKQGTAKDEQ